MKESEATTPARLKNTSIISRMSLLGQELNLSMKISAPQSFFMRKIEGNIICILYTQNFIQNLKVIIATAGSKSKKLKVCVVTVANLLNYTKAFFL